MYTEEEVKPELLRLYSELGYDPKRIKDIRIIEYKYQIVRDDGALTEIPRIAIDDYYGKEPGKIIGREKIMQALRNFR